MRTDTKTKAVKLPRKLAPLLRLALDDLRKVERSKRYEVNMGDWHSPNSYCSVCLAGSVIAKTLDSDPKREIGPWNFGIKTQCALVALDHLRKGLVSSALGSLGKKCTEDFDRSVIYYHDNRLQWWKDMRKLLRDLEAANL